MGQRESELLGEKLFYVGTFDIVRLLDFDNFEDLVRSIRMPHLERVWDVTYMD